MDGSLRNWRVPALVGLVELSRLTMLAMLPEKKLVMYLPDDTFYYLVLGKNFAASGRWTFDGVEPASGFHLLWGYMIAGLYWVAPRITLHGVVLVAGTFSVACAVLATRLMVRTAAEIFGADADAGVALVCLSALALEVDLFLMEAGVALLLSALVVQVLCRMEAGRWGPAAGFALGVAGVAARSEFGLLPLCLLGMQVVLWRRRVSSGAMVWLAGAVLMGSVMGELGLVLHTHWISGHWVQASAEEKLFWSRNMGFSMTLVGFLLGDFFDLTYNSAMNPRHTELLGLWKWVPIALLLAGLAVIWARRSTAARRGIIAGLGCAVGAFVLLYRFDGAGIQAWYVAAIEAPIAVLAGGGLSFYVARWRGATLTLTAALCCWGVGHSYAGQFAWQRPLWNAGMYVRAHPEVRPVGAWNAGIISYFAGGEVTNLDGLVNDSILPYTKAGTLLEYVERRRLRTIVDYSTWFRPFIALNGGYANGDLARCLETVDVLKGDPDVDQWNTVRLFVVKPECGGAGVTPR